MWLRNTTSMGRGKGEHTCLFLAIAIVIASPAAAAVQLRTVISYDVFGPPFGITDVAADRQGNIFVGLPSDLGSSVLKFDSSGEFITGLDTGPSGTLGLTVATNGDVYASHGAMIRRYTNDGIPREPAFVTDSLLGQGKLAIDDFLNLYVAPPGTSLSQDPLWKLSPTGSVAARFGLTDGLGIAVERGENLFALNHQPTPGREPFSFIRRYTSAGNPLAAPVLLENTMAKYLGIDPLNGQMFVACWGEPPGDVGSRRNDFVRHVTSNGVVIEDFGLNEFPRNDTISALQLDRVGNLYIAAHAPILPENGVRNARVYVYDRIVRTDELGEFVDELLNTAGSDAFPGYEQFTDFVRQASRTERGLTAIFGTQQALPGFRDAITARDIAGGFDNRRLPDAVAQTIETIDGILTQFLDHPPNERQEVRLVGGLKDPFYGRYHSTAPLSFPLPSHVDFVLDPGSAITTISKSQALGRREQPRVLSSTIGIDLVGGVPTVTDFTFELAPFRVGDRSTGPNHGFLPPGAQVWAQITSPTSFEGHPEGWIVNDLYPATRPLFTFVDLHGYFFAVHGRNDATVYGVNEPILRTGLPGGAAHVASRRSFCGHAHAVRCRERAAFVSREHQYRLAP